MRFAPFIAATALIASAVGLTTAAAWPCSQGTAPSAPIAAHVHVLNTEVQDQSTGDTYTLVTTGSWVAWHYHPGLSHRLVTETTLTLGGYNADGFDHCPQPLNTEDWDFFRFLTPGAYLYGDQYHQTVNGQVVVR